MQGTQGIQEYQEIFQNTGCKRQLHSKKKEDKKWQII